MRANSQLKKFDDYGYCELRSIDPTCNRRRYYSIAVMPGLFQPAILHRSWGRIGYKPRCIESFCDDLGEAFKLANRIYMEKLRKGCKNA